MLHNLLNSILPLLGKKNYTLDPDISFVSTIAIAGSRLNQFLRGLAKKPFFKKSGILFVSKGARITHCNKITLGNIVTFESGVSINGLTKQGIIIGNNVTFKSQVIVDSGLMNNIGEGLIIGNNVGISQQCFLQASAMLKIGNNVIIGPGTKIFTEDHTHSDINTFINTQGVDRAPVVIEDGVWIGSNSIILKGVTIGSNSIIGAGALVKIDVPPNSICVGAPAKVIKQRTK